MSSSSANNPFGEQQQQRQHDDKDEGRMYHSTTTTTTTATTSTTATTMNTNTSTVHPPVVPRNDSLMSNGTEGSFGDSGDMHDVELDLRFGRQVSDASIDAPPMSIVAPPKHLAIDDIASQYFFDSTDRAASKRLSSATAVTASAGVGATATMARRGSDLLLGMIQGGGGGGEGGGGGGGGVLSMGEAAAAVTADLLAIEESVVVVSGGDGGMIELTDGGPSAGINTGRRVSGLFGGLASGARRSMVSLGGAAGGGSQRSLGGGSTPSLGGESNGSPVPSSSGMMNGGGKRSLLGGVLGRAPSFTNSRRQLSNRSLMSSSKQRLDPEHTPEVSSAGYKNYFEEEDHEDEELESEEEESEEEGEYGRKHSDDFSLEMSYGDEHSSDEDEEDDDHYFRHGGMYNKLSIHYPATSLTRQVSTGSNGSRKRRKNKRLQQQQQGQEGGVWSVFSTTLSRAPTTVTKKVSSLKRSRVLQKIGGRRKNDQEMDTIMSSEYNDDDDFGAAAGGEYGPDGANVQCYAKGIQLEEHITLRRRRNARCLLVVLVISGILAATASTMFVVKHRHHADDPTTENEDVSGGDGPSVDPDGGGDIDSGRNRPFGGHEQQQQQQQQSQDQGEQHDTPASDVPGSNIDIDTMTEEGALFIPNPAILVFLQNVGLSSPTDLANPTSPQYRAMKWLSDDESIEDYLSNSPANAIAVAGGEIADPEIIALERYSLAVLYYSTITTTTTVNNNGGSVGTAITGPASGEIEDSSWNVHTKWISDFPVCEWHGITCSHVGMTDRVISIDLVENNLDGSVPNEIGLLGELTSLNLRENQLVGVIPMYLGKCTQLTTLDLSHNRLRGNLIAEDIVGSLMKLEQINLSNNQMEGAIPYWIKMLKNLQVLDLSHNTFTDAIPVQLSELTKLRQLDLSHNSLEGVIPDPMETLTQVTHLRLSGNKKLRGNLPKGMVHWTSLIQLAIDDNSFQGQLPHWLHLLDSLEVLTLDNNKFTGDVPQELVNLIELRVLTLHGNEGLSGRVPDRLCSMDHHLDMLTADCAGEEPRVSCSCCTCP